MSRITVFLTILLLSFSTASAQYSGRYSDGKDYAVYFEQTPYGLTIRPVMWTATQLLREVEKDRFEVVDRASRSAQFRRGRDGTVTGVSISGMDGEGLELSRSDGPPLPVELFLAGRTREAAEGYVARDALPKAIETAEQILRRLPTKTRHVVAFLKHLAPRFERDVKFQTLLGYAYVQFGDREAALSAFRRAYDLDPKAPDTISALARLNALTATGGVPGWTLPFPLSSVFAKPAAIEIAEVERDWAKRDLRPAGVKEETQATVTFGEHRFQLRIVSHLVHGKRHYGAVFVPEKGFGRRLPVIIEAKGVSPTYFPLDVERIASPRMMGPSASDFIYVVPGFRGEVVKLKDASFTSEGDRRDALDGATDDALALLNVAIETTPAADPTRICAFGHSRGGNVAMLLGIRDKRVDCVVNWAGPTDWFYAMGTNGWTEQELWSEGLRTRATPQQTGGQNVERFLQRAIEGKATLQQVRHNMIASSPLYFAQRLPTGQHHYGIEDPFVPLRNVTELLAKMRGMGMNTATGHSRHRLTARHQFYLYPEQGHDTDRLFGPVISRDFILKVLQ